MLREFGQRLWLCTPMGRAQAEHQRILARLRAYCRTERTASVLVNGLVSRSETDALGAPERGVAVKAVRAEREGAPRHFGTVGYVPRSVP